MTFDPERALNDGKALMGSDHGGYMEVRILCIDRPKEVNHSHLPILAMNVETGELYLYRWNGTSPFRHACLKNICRKMRRWGVVNLRKDRSDIYGILMAAVYSNEEDALDKAAEIISQQQYEAIVVPIEWTI